MTPQVNDRVSIARSPMTAGILHGKDRSAKEEIMALTEKVISLISSD